MPDNLKRGLLRNWPIKIAALFLSLMLYVAVASQQTVTQTFALKLAVLVPRGRALLNAPPGVSVVVTGKGRELLKLRTFPRVINLAVPDTFSGSVWHTALRSSDVDVPKGVDVEVARVIPEEIELTLDSVAHKDVPIIPRVSVVPDSGQVLRGGLSLTPGVAHLVGSDRSLATIDSVMTVPTRLTGLSGHFAQLVPVDTSPLGAVRIAPKQVEVAGEVGANFDRSFAGLLVESGAGALTGYSVTPARVSVSVRGPDSLVQVLTRERLKVIAHLRGADGWAKLTVIAPAGIVARAVPDSVNLKRKSGHD